MHTHIYTYLVQYNEMFTLNIRQYYNPKSQVTNITSEALTEKSINMVCII